MVIYYLIMGHCEGKNPILTKQDHNSHCSSSHSSLMNDIVWNINWCILIIKYWLQFVLLGNRKQTESGRKWSTAGVSNSNWRGPFQRLNNDRRAILTFGKDAYDCVNRKVKTGGCCGLEGGGDWAVNGPQASSLRPLYRAGLKIPWTFCAKFCLWSINFSGNK